MGRKEEESKVRRSPIIRLIRSKFPGTMPVNQAYPQVENNDQQFSDVRLILNIHEPL